VAISVDTEHGKWFQRTLQDLHNRRTGRRGSHRWNRELLEQKVPRPPLKVLDDYFRGDPPLSKSIHSEWKPYIRAFLRAGRYNIAEKTVTGTSNRMTLRGFYTAAVNDEDGDQLAHEIMLANEFDILTSEVHDFMLRMGDGFTLTQPPVNGDDQYGRTTAEDPRQVTTVHDPLTGAIVAGVKLYRDDWDEADFAHLALRLDDGSVVMQKFRHESRKSIITDGLFRFDPESWELDGEEIDCKTVMPFERFGNRFGVGEYEWHLDTLDRLNDKIFHEWWIAKIQAFRQRAVKNLPDTETKIDQETGEKREVEIDYTDMFTSAPDEMWRVPADVDFWESIPVDLTPITASIQKDLERYCAARDIPLHIVSPDAANGSAEGATLMREEHVFRIADKVKRVDRRWCSVMAKHFAFMDTPESRQRADVAQIRSDWAPVQTFSLEQQASAGAQMKGVLPQEAIWRKAFQYAPGEIKALRQQMGRERFMTTGVDMPAPSLPGGLPPFQPPAPPTPPSDEE
jgi:hypothetical protein